MRIVLTGSSSGIGYALAESLLERGHQVLGLARSEQKDLTARYSAQFTAVKCDIADWDQVDAAAKAAQSDPFDAIICCAGLQGAVGETVKIDPKQWSSTVRTNLDGTFYTIRAFFSLLRQDRGRAKIICFSGGGATKPRPNFSAYGVAKTGIVRLVETLAEELQGQMIDVNAVAPGAINTRLTDEVVALGPLVVGEAEYAAALKQKAAGDSSLIKVLGLIDFLLSTKSDGISGRLLSAPWDAWDTLDSHIAELKGSDIFTLRRIVPDDRNKRW